MVLKINSNNNDNWRFIDGIKEIQVEPMPPERYNRDYRGHGRMYDNAFLIYHKIGDELTLVEPSMIVGVKEVTVWFDADKKPASYIVDVSTFLMSDEGKTIERIN